MSANIEGIELPPQDWMPEFRTVEDPVTGNVLRVGMCREVYGARLGYLLSTYDHPEYRGRQPEADKALRLALWFLSKTGTSPYESFAIGNSAEERDAA